ncbi:hypothetical protein AMECASPLE_033924 [Ameca splendens]|uniref:Uncharacterized protein n=1 Tax=Ameca splendens TaxID=208324 RepID=A0ABV1AF52_9TELE
MVIQTVCFCLFLFIYCIPFIYNIAVILLVTIIGPGSIRCCLVHCVTLGSLGFLFITFSAAHVQSCFCPLKELGFISRFSCRFASLLVVFHFALCPSVSPAVIFDAFVIILHLYALLRLVGCVSVS